MSEWVASLEKLGEDGGSEVSGLKLLGYFQNMVMALNPEEFEIVAESVVGAEPLDVAAVSKWLLRWRESGFVREVIEISEPLIGSRDLAEPRGLSTSAIHSTVLAE